jgi:deoxycytidine triphosphate deaminase
MVLRGGETVILSDKALKDRIIQDTKVIKQAREWWRKGDWANIGNKLVIDPFETSQLGVCTYDLTVGEEYLSLRDPDNPKPLKEGEKFKIGPSETVLILTEEYTCLPQNMMAMSVPRARWIFEGTCIHSSRVEPTWYGKLLIGFTNLAKNPVFLTRGETFCTCYFIEASKAEAILTKDKVPFLGRAKIGRVDFTHVREQRLRPADKVDLSDIDKVVDLYGWPWDVVRGMLHLTRKEIGEWIEKEVTSDIVGEATAAAVKTAFDELSAQYREANKWNRNLVIAIMSVLGVIGAAIAGAAITYIITAFT